VNTATDQLLARWTGWPVLSKGAEVEFVRVNERMCLARARRADGALTETTATAKSGIPPRPGALRRRVRLRLPGGDLGPHRPGRRVRDHASRGPPSRDDGHAPRTWHWPVITTGGEHTSSHRWSPSTGTGRRVAGARPRAAPPARLERTTRSPPVPAHPGHHHRRSAASGVRRPGCGRTPMGFAPDRRVAETVLAMTAALGPRLMLACGGTRPRRSAGQVRSSW
jgi:hypothetical protein